MNLSLPVLYPSLFLASAGALAQVPVSITDARVVEAPPGSVVNAGYMRIRNTGSSAVELESVSSPVTGRIEVHQSITEGNVTRMVRHRTLQIPAGDEVELVPGGFHLMIYNDGKRLENGQTIPITAGFSDGTVLEVRAVVEKMSGRLPGTAEDRAVPEKPEDGSGFMASYQNFLPQHFLSGLMYLLARLTWPPLKNLFIKSFIRFYGVDMSIAEKSDPRDYVHFNAFFTRALKPGVRPVDDTAGVVVSPVDGIVSQAGNISEGRLVQAKGRSYSLSALLGGDEALAKRFGNGSFITLYLSPRDYHRIHMPVAGRLEKMTYIPGRLFSVNQATTRGVDNLFARNERVINIFETGMGKMALIMVGAIFVGSMETVWAGEITPAEERKPSTVDYPEKGGEIRLDKGQEMGRFNMGSTVILLFEPGRLEWEGQPAPGDRVTLGRRLAAASSGPPGP